jgi:hypothetical protein
MLLFSVYDALDRLEKLRANLEPAEAAAEPAKVEKAVPDARRPDAADTSETEWKKAYGYIESFMWDVVHMAQIADGIVSDTDSENLDQMAWHRLAFAVNHSRAMLEDFQQRYLEQDWERPRDALLPT